MSPPPARWRPGQLHTPPPRVGEKVPYSQLSKQRTRRKVLVQCEECGATATGTSAGTRLVSANLPFVRCRNVGLRHATDGGRLVGFDILDQDDDL